MRRPFVTLFLVLVTISPACIPTLLAQSPCGTQELVVGEASGLPGGWVNVDVLGGVSCEVTGFSMAIGHENTRLSFLDATPGQFLLGHAGADLFFQVSDHDVDGYTAIGAIFDMSSPLTIPPTPIESGTVLATVTYEILAGTPPGTTPLLNRSDVYGDIPVRNIYSGPPGSKPIEPVLVDGAVTIADSPAAFRRGDANTDGRVDISDVVFVLLYLFRSGQPPPCQKSADFDDTGSIVLTDAVFLLNALFRGGLPPPAPHSECGTDPTGDLLACDSFPACVPAP